MAFLAPIVGGLGAAGAGAAGAAGAGGAAALAPTAAGAATGLGSLGAALPAVGALTPTAAGAASGLGALGAAPAASAAPTLAGGNLMQSLAQTFNPQSLLKDMMSPSSSGQQKQEAPAQPQLVNLQTANQFAQGLNQGPDYMKNLKTFIYGGNQ